VSGSETVVFAFWIAFDIDPTTKKMLFNAKAGVPLVFLIMFAGRFANKLISEANALKRLYKYQDEYDYLEAKSSDLKCDICGKSMERGQLVAHIATHLDGRRASEIGVVPQGEKSEEQIRQCHICSKRIVLSKLRLHTWAHKIEPALLRMNISQSVEGQSVESRKLSTSEAAQAIGVTRGTLQGYIQSGRLTTNPDGTINATELLRAGFVIRNLSSRRD
jgi:hypothetical protein